MHHLMLVRLVGRLAVRLLGRCICSHPSILVSGLIGRVVRPGEAVLAVQGGGIYHLQSPRSWRTRALRICLSLLLKQPPAMGLSGLVVDLGARILRKEILAATSHLEEGPSQIWFLDMKPCRLSPCTRPEPWIRPKPIHLLQ